jgi:peptidoglycan/LPS O-acetylase OafA/YrhL
VNKLTNTKQHFYFLDWLRAIAAWLVVWAHMVAHHTKNTATSFLPATYVEEYITTPLGIIQDFGWFGVAVFFLISGFIITHVSQRETLKEFVVKRCFKIFPLYILAIMLSIFLLDEVYSQFSIEAMFTNMLLINYWISPQIVLLGVAWTLAVEVVFYALFAVFFKFKQNPKLLISSNLAFVFVVVSLSRSFGDDFFLFAATVAYLPFIIAGQIIYFGLFTKQITVLTTISFFILCYAAMLTGITTIHSSFLPTSNSYLLSFCYALLLFVFALMINERLKPNKIVRVMADTSYAVYLIHCTLGLFVMYKLIPIFGYPSSLLLSICLVFITSYILHIKIEKPLLLLARKL